MNALDPATLNSNIIEGYPAPMEYFSLVPRVDFTITKNNFMNIRDQYTRYSAQGAGVGALVLPEQATGGLNWSNDVQIGDTWIINSHLLMEPRFLWRRISNNSTSNSSTPAISVQGAFTAGGNGEGTLHDHQDQFTLQNYGTATVGPHTLRFGGARPRLPRCRLLHRRRQWQLLLQLRFDVARVRITHTRPRNRKHIPPPSLKIRWRALFSLTARSLCRTTGA